MRARARGALVAWPWMLLSSRLIKLLFLKALCVWVRMGLGGQGRAGGWVGGWVDGWVGVHLNRAGAKAAQARRAIVGDGVRACVCDGECARALVCSRTRAQRVCVLFGGVRRGTGTGHNLTQAAT